jgi:hypothetical protein
VRVEFRAAELVIDVLDDGRAEPRDARARVAPETAPETAAETTAGPRSRAQQPNADQCAASARFGFGIAGMRERVALLGGLFSAGPRPEGGFQVTARLPA